MHHKEFKHADGTFIELYVVKQYWKVHQSGHLDYFFDRVQTQQENEDKTEDTLIAEAVDDHPMVKFTPHKQLRLLLMLLM